MKILIPVDDSDTSRRAIDWVAHQQRQLTPLQVELLNVRGEPEHYGAVALVDRETVDRALREGQQRVLAGALQHAQRMGLDQVAIQATQGVPAPAIVEAAKAGGVDQIVMSTHGRGAVGKLLMGSVAQEVAHLAPMAVTLVK